MAEFEVLVQAIVTKPGLVSRSDIESSLEEASRMYAAAGIKFTLAGLEEGSFAALQKDRGPDAPTARRLWASRSLEKLKQSSTPEEW